MFPLIHTGCIVREKSRYLWSLLLGGFFLSINADIVISVVVYLW